jgi:hypothetical protein
MAEMMDDPDALMEEIDLKMPMFLDPRVVMMAPSNIDNKGMMVVAEIIIYGLSMLKERKDEEAAAWQQENWLEFRVYKSWCGTIMTEAPTTEPDRKMLEIFFTELQLNGQDEMAILTPSYCNLTLVDCIREQGQFLGRYLWVMRRRFHRWLRNMWYDGYDEVIRPLRNLESGTWHYTEQKADRIFSEFFWRRYEEEDYKILMEHGKRRCDCSNCRNIHFTALANRFGVNRRCPIAAPGWYGGPNSRTDYIHFWYELAS